MFFSLLAVICSSAEEKQTPPMITAASGDGSGHEVASVKVATYIETNYRGNPSKRKVVYLIEIADDYVDKMEEDTVVVWWASY